MNYLLDTHTFLWFIAGDNQLSRTARKQIENPSNLSFLSIVRFWEIAIKFSLGRLTLHQPFEELFPEQLAINGIDLLELDFRHTVVIAKLPFHHKDPFDRMLIAQAQAEGLHIISKDSAFDEYAISQAW